MKRLVRREKRRIELELGVKWNNDYIRNRKIFFKEFNKKKEGSGNVSGSGVKDADGNILVDKAQ